MIMTQTEANAFAAYLRSVRTTTQTQVLASAVNDTPKYRYDTAHTNTRHVPSAH